MKTVILVPFRGDNGPRDEAWEYVCDQWSTMGLSIFVGDSEDETFERGEARNDAARRASDWDLALFVDADILLNTFDQADAALMRAWRTGAYTVAHSFIRYLTEKGTRRALRGGSLAGCGWDDRNALTWESCFAVRRDLWDAVGGFDPRFRGYGGQGIAFYYAASTLGGRERINGSAYHLYHPYADRSLEPHFDANMELCERYRAVVDRPTAMRALLKEAR